MACATQVSETKINKMDEQRKGKLATDDKVNRPLVRITVHSSSRVLVVCTIPSVYNYYYYRRTKHCYSILCGTIEI
jgi:hypothetical protein